MPKLSIRDLDLTDKRVLIRVDFNVPLKDGIITDDTRIRETLPTIEYALRHKAKVILCSHLGRPKGKPVDSMSLRPLVAHLRGMLDHILGDDENVAFSPNCVGVVASEMPANLESGQPLLLENLRFHPEEEANDPIFAKKLASLCDVYVNDAFGSAHRAHASTEGITHFVAPAVAGLLMEKELEYLGKALQNPERPYTAIVGGAKVSDKIEFLERLISTADAVLVGGAMAYTFLKAQGLEVGRSKVEDDKLDLARELLKAAQGRNIKLALPQDHVVADKIDAGARAQVVGRGAIPPDRIGVDIGPAPRAEYAREIARSKMIVWNGPMGVFEIPQFAQGTLEIARAVAASPATSIVGGGDSVAAVAQAGVASKITHISTGGGASLEFLSGMKLPGVEVLTDRQSSVVSRQ